MVYSDDMVLLKFTAILCLVISGVVGLNRINIDEPSDPSNDAATYVVNYGDAMGFEIAFNARFDNENSISRRNDHLVYSTSSEGYEIGGNDDEAFDSWSVVWYIASFGGLIGFFLVVSCSEWCCRRHIRDAQPRRDPGTVASPPSTPTESPPPAYDLFAPPSYDSLSSSPNEKREYDIYVVPVHAISSLVESENARQENPPSYSSITLEEDTATATVPRT